MTIEELQEALLNEQEKNKTLTAESEKLKATSEELKTTNNSLMEANNKLFMRLATPVEEKQKPQELTTEQKEAQQIEEIRTLMQDRR